MRIVEELQIFETSRGARIYQIPMEAFPGLITFAYLVIFKDMRVLIDAGSGYGDSNQQLISGLQEAGLIDCGKQIYLEDLSHILITHGHIDHFGGLQEITTQSNALIGVHDLDRRNITNYQERRALVARRLETYLSEAGVESASRENLLALYRFTKQLFQSVKIDFSYNEIGMQLADFEFLHVPGHCAGHVVIRLHDILFCGDHILTDISPHQAPEQLAAWTGLDHYLHSLDAVETWAADIQFVLCGHKKVIDELPARIREIREMHMERLELVMEFLRSPQSVYSLSKSLFGEPNGYDALLAVEEAGAHVEYLYQRGRLTVDNYEQIENTSEPIPHLYKCQ